MGVGSLFGLLIFIILFYAILMKYSPKKERIKYDVRRHLNIFKSQLKMNLIEVLKYVLLFAAVTVLFLIFIKLIHRELSSVFSITYENSEIGGAVQVFTTSTTVFTTLMTVILALIALAVTAYVFLNDVLSSRKSYEQRVISTVKHVNTIRLFYLAIYSGICIIGCFAADNLSILAGRSIILYTIAILSLFDVLLLILFVNTIVNYEVHLAAHAESYIMYNQGNLISELEPEGLDSEESNHLQVATEVIKRVGDLESLILSLNNRHESEFRYSNDLVGPSLITSIIAKKERNIEDVIEQKVSQYGRLVEIRNCIWILQNVDEELTTVYIDPRLNMILKKLTAWFVQNAFAREYFQKLNYTDMSFEKAKFDYSSFVDSNFTNVKFNEAKMNYISFLGCHMQNCDFSDIECSDSDFSTTKLIQPVFTEKSNFKNAMFVDAEIVFDTIGPKTNDLGESKVYYQFSGTNFRHANLVGGSFTSIDFENSVFRDASFAGGRFTDCNFALANLSNAVLANVVVDINCNFMYANCTGITAVYSKWGEKLDDVHGKGARLNLASSRFVSASFTNAHLANCNFLGSYMNDATFRSARIENCDFTQTLLTNVDFTESSIDYCYFDEATLNNALFVGFETDHIQRSFVKKTKRSGLQKLNLSRSTIQYVSFSGASMVGIEIRGYNFKNCVFDNVVFDDAVIREVKFIHCDFNHVRMKDALVFNVEWEDCNAKADADAEKEIDFGSESDRQKWKKVFIK